MSSWLFPHKKDLVGCFALQHWAAPRDFHMKVECEFEVGGTKKESAFVVQSALVAAKLFQSLLLLTVTLKSVANQAGKLIMWVALDHRQLDACRNNPNHFEIVGQPIHPTHGHTLLVQPTMHFTPCWFMVLARQKVPRASSLTCLKRGLPQKAS